MSLWMPGAVIVPGHPDKVGYDALGFGSKGPKRGTVVHSAEGWAAYLKFLVQSPLAIKSWHFSVLTDGTKWQHYPVNVHCWHAGDTDDDDDVRANIELDGIEEEGVAGTPLTAEQVASTVEIIQFQADHFGRAAHYDRFPVQPSDGWTLVEHNEVSNTYTACPSGRVPWETILATLEQQEDEDMYALIIKKGEEQDTNNEHRTYLWRSGSPALLHMGSKAQREQTADLYGISPNAVTVDRATLDAL